MTEATPWVSPTELTIQAAIVAIENGPQDPELLEAKSLLEEALEKVSAFVDRQQANDAEAA